LTPIAHYELILKLENETASVVLLKSEEALPEDLMSRTAPERSKN